MTAERRTRRDAVPGDGEGGGGTTGGVGTGGGAAAAGGMVVAAAAAAAGEEVSSVDDCAAFGELEWRCIARRIISRNGYTNTHTHTFKSA